MYDGTSIGLTNREQTKNWTKAGHFQFGCGSPFTVVVRSFWSRTKNTASLLCVGTPHMKLLLCHCAIPDEDGYTARNDYYGCTVPVLWRG